MKSEELTPGFGSEVFGIRLDQLDSQGRDQLALEVARRGVIAFRDQSFGEQSGEWLKDWGRVSDFGPLFPTSELVLVSLISK